MKSASAALIALLAASKEYAMTETYTFTLIDGSTLVYTVGDPDNGTQADPSEIQAPIIT